MEKLPSIIHETWHPFLQPIFDDDFSLKILKNHILPNCEFYPEAQNIFRVFSMPLNNIKIVILGQDPYPNEGQAIGYAFAVSESISKPVSLKVIEKEVGHELDRTLQTWINQGVFLLNTALTVQAKKAGSHIDYWKSFTIQVIRIISQYVSPIWFLWGKKAQEFEVHILATDYSKKNVILKAPHPAAESYTGFKAGFLGCNHFKTANEILAQTNSTINF